MSSSDLIERSYLGANRLPLVLRPTIAGVKLISWASDNRNFIEDQLLQHGAVLFRHFNLDGAAEFEALIETLYSHALEYHERSSPRSQVSGKIYTSTDYPPDQSIFLHNENSYQSSWPMRIFFFCAVPAIRGGETPIADCRRVLSRIAPQIRERFAEKKWMYVRNFGQGVGLTWQSVFQTTDRSDVEDYCRKNGIKVKWKEDDRLCVSAVRPPISRHPQTGELVWFNHAVFFHVSTMEPQVQEALLTLFGAEGLPSNSYYGDGTEITLDVLEALRDAYHQETVRFQWEAGDLLVIDNMLVAHGRAPYSGPRKILVGMAQPTRWDLLEQGSKTTLTHSDPPHSAQIV